MRTTSGDGLIAGFGAANGHYFDDAKSRCAILAYDYMVKAGTQGYFNQKKACRILDLAAQWRVPVVWWTEGGGGRPGDVDTDLVKATGLGTHTGVLYARLAGLVPRIAINQGRCFAGNAVIFGASDITIATQNSSIGLGGPAMIEAGGLGLVHPDEVGPMSMQGPNGVVDVTVANEIDAAKAAKQVLSYFQGPLPSWTFADQRDLRRVIPENRARAYDPRKTIAIIADEGSMVELRREFAKGMITALVRVEGRPFGLICNDGNFMAGVIDSDGSDKAARFLQLCDAFDLPVISLIDTPGFLVGPESERTGAVRHGARLLVIGANITVPIFAVVLRRCYGFGGTAMAGGSLRAPFYVIAWPSAEFGGMAPQGAVTLGYRMQLDAVTDPAEKKALNDNLVNSLYERGKPTNVAQYLEIDAVIDPVETRSWLMRGLKSCQLSNSRERKKLPFVDTW